MVQFVRDVFTTVRGVAVLFSVLVSAIFVNAAVGFWTAEWRTASGAFPMAAAEPSPTILENAVTSSLIDRCITCHQDLAEHPGTFVADHRPEAFGCTLCHDGIGRAATSKDAHAMLWPEEVALKTGRDVQPNCLSCHIEQFNLPGADVLNEGKSLLYEKRCVRCHRIGSFDEAYPDLSGLYPAGNLGRIANGMSAEWMYRYIKDPLGVAARTAMPTFGFEDADVSAIVSYLVANRYDDFESRYSPALGRTANVDRGGRLIRTLGCLACHALGAEGNADQIDNTREFDNIGSFFSPEYLFSVIEPALDGTSHSPPISLSQAEAYDLTAYLSTREAPTEKEYPVSLADGDGLADRGRELIQEHNCYGCHTIPGFEGVPPALPELSSIGDKEIEYDGTRREYLISRMKNPKAVDPLSRMPVVYMTDDEAESIATVLMGLKSAEVPAHLEMDMTESEAVLQQAERMSTHEFQCSTCHLMPWQDPDDESVVIGPDLAETADNLTISQIAEKLSNPHEQRPNAFRMPFFDLDDDAVLTLIRALRLR